MKDLFAVDKTLRERNRTAYHQAAANLRHYQQNPASTPEQLAAAEFAANQARLRWWGWTGLLPKVPGPRRA